MDQTFGTGGTLVGGEAVQQEALGVAVQPDGKIVAAGYTVRDGAVVVRYLADGKLDDTFGTDGVATVGIDGRANDVVVQDDGSIVVAGIVSRDREGEEFGDLFVARLLATGGLDLSFGLGAPVVTDVGGLTNEAQM